MSEKFCTQCGASLSDDVRFCTQCGTPRSGGAAPQATPQSPATSHAVRARSDAGAGLRRYAPLLVVAGIVVVVGAAIVAGVLAPKDPPRIVARQGAEAGSSPPAPGAMPSDHPPLTIPEQVKQAIADLEKTAAENPEDLRSWGHLAEVLYRASQIDREYLDGADRAFQRILEIDPDSREALRGLGNIAYERNQPKEAIPRYERYLELEPDDLSVQTDLGTMFLADGQAERAVRTYDAVLKKDPNFFQAQFNLAIAYRSAGQDEAGLAMLRKARDNAPDDQTRSQIDMVLARGEHAAAAPADIPVEEAGPKFRTAIESIIRTHQILASKVQRFDWQDDTNLTLVLTGFPMAQMPESMRDIFMSRMQERIGQAKAANGVVETVTIALVDFESGERMDSIVQ